MKRPLAGLTLAFSLGIFSAGLIKIHFAFFYFLTVAFLFACLFSLEKNFLSDILLFCLAFCLGALLLRNSQILPANHIKKFISYKNDAPDIVKGVIDTHPEFKKDRQSFILKAEEIQIDNLRRKCSGRVLVYLKGREKFSYGEELILSGNLYRPFGKTDFLYRQGIFLIMNIKTPVAIARLNRNKGSRVKGFALRLKDKIGGIIRRRVPLPLAGVIEAMVLGEKKNIPPLVYNSMVKTGTVHILPRLYTKMPPVAL